jgi:hypothetical protein
MIGAMPLLGLVVMSASPSASDVDVDPAPWSPSVHIEVQKHSRPVPARSAQIPASKGVASAGLPMPVISGPRESSGWVVANCVITPTTVDCPETAPAPSRRQLTAGEVRRAVSEIPMPALRVTVQPGGRTLVNVPTILHTDPRPVRESITLLGHDIDVEARPTSYTWHHGDGTSRTTTRPGRPYPAKDVTHTYQRTADQVSIRVDTTYTVRYRVDGGAWTPLGQPLTATGAATPLEVAEAAPVLVSPRR